MDLPKSVKAWESERLLTFLEIFSIYEHLWTNQICELCIVEGGKGKSIQKRDWRFWKNFMCLFVRRMVAEGHMTEVQQFVFKHHANNNTLDCANTECWNLVFEDGLFQVDFIIIKSPCYSNFSYHQHSSNRYQVCTSVHKCEKQNIDIFLTTLYTFITEKNVR